MFATKAPLIMHGALNMPYVQNLRSGTMEDLPIEKQLTHTIFCKQIENISLDEAKQLLIELHLLYLRQTETMERLAKWSMEFKQ